MNKQSVTQCKTNYVVTAPHNRLIRTVHRELQKHEKQPTKIRVKRKEQIWKGVFHSNAHFIWKNVGFLVFNWKVDGRQQSTYTHTTAKDVHNSLQNKELQNIKCMFSNYHNQLKQSTCTARYFEFIIVNYHLYNPESFKESKTKRKQIFSIRLL